MSSLLYNFFAARVGQLRSLIASIDAQTQAKVASAADYTPITLYDLWTMKMKEVKELQRAQSFLNDLGRDKAAANTAPGAKPADPAETTLQTGSPVAGPSGASKKDDTDGEADVFEDAVEYQHGPARTTATTPKRPETKMPDPENCTVVVRNLPQHFTEDDLKTLFDGFSICKTRVPFPGTPIIFVTLPSPLWANLACHQLNGKAAHGTTLHVHLKVPTKTSALKRRGQFEDHEQDSWQPAKYRMAREADPEERQEVATWDQGSGSPFRKQPVYNFAGNQSPPAAKSRPVSCSSLGKRNVREEGKRFDEPTKKKYHVDPEHHVYRSHAHVEEDHKTIRHSKRQRTGPDV